MCIDLASTCSLGVVAAYLGWQCVVLPHSITYAQPDIGYSFSLAKLANGFLSILLWYIVAFEIDLSL